MTTDRRQASETVSNNTYMHVERQNESSAEWSPTKGSGTYRVVDKDESMDTPYSSSSTIEIVYFTPT